MTTVEIRNRRQPLIGMIVGVSIVGLANGFLITKRKFNDNPAFFILCVLGFLICLYMIYRFTRKLQYKGPELRFTPTDLEIYANGKPISYLWQQIIDWKIEKSGNDNHLIIDTTTGKSTISITWFDKKPDEIAALMQQYKK